MTDQGHNHHHAPEPEARPSAHHGERHAVPPEREPHAAGSAIPHSEDTIHAASEALGSTAIHDHPEVAADEHAQHPGHAEPAGPGTHADHGGHDGHAGHSEAMFKRPFWTSLLLTIPVLIYSEFLQDLLGYMPPMFPGSTWLVPVLASVIYWHGGWIFLTGAIGELRTRRLGMMTLVSLTITTAYLYSLAITVGLADGIPFYWELATLVTIMLLGHWLELRGGRHRAGQERPARCGADHHAQPGQLSEDAAEPGLGGRLQHDCPAAGRRHPGAVRAGAAGRRRRAADVAQHHHRRPQCPVAPPPSYQRGGGVGASFTADAPSLARSARRASSRRPCLPVRPAGTGRSWRRSGRGTGQRTVIAGASAP